MIVEPAWWLVLAALGAAVALGALTPRLASVPAVVTGRRVVLLALVAVLALQPRVAASEVPVTSVDVLLLIDRTTSMGATDHDGGRSRIEGVADDVHELITQMPGARFAVVTFDNAADVALPWTSDTSAVDALGQTLGWRPDAQASGSDISVAVGMADELLTAAEASRPHVPRYVVYFGDGEQTSQEPLESFAGLAPRLAGALVLGYGTQAGATMPLQPGSEDLVSRNDTPQRSRIDEGNLDAIAAELGGDYLHRGAPGGVTFWPEDPAATAGPATAEGAVPPAWALGLLIASLVLLELCLTVRDARRLWKDLR